MSETLSWADRARQNSPKPMVAQPSATVPTSNMPPPATPPGTGMIKATVGQLTVDMWSMVLSYCQYSTVVRISHTCFILRRLALKKPLWVAIQDSFALQFEMDVGHAAPTMEFGFPVGLSSTLTASSDGRPSSGATIVTDENEAAAEFIRYSRFLTKSEHRMWHLKEVRNSLAPVVNGNVRLAWVASYDPAQPAPALAIPITILAADRNGPYIKPSEISTVFSHVAANALAVCRISTVDVTASYSSLFLQRLGCALGTSTLHRELGKILVSAALIELSRPEAVQCVESFLPSASTTYPANLLLSDITIDDHETKYFAIRQLSTEAHIGIIFVDPILVLGLCVGRSYIGA